ncbi:TPA: IS1595 family transposase, partial [Neisseria gonorrhoeae]
MSGVTKELDILKQLFENLSDTDKQAFLTSVSSKEQVKKVIEPRKVTKCPHCQSTHFVKNGKD